MPVEFRCPHCDRLLQVPDTARGQQARCGGCQGVAEVPSLPNQAAATGAPLSASVRPWETTAEQSSSGAIVSPYIADQAFAGQLSAAEPGYIDNLAAERLQKPAIAIIFLATLGLLYFLAALISGLASGWEGLGTGIGNLDPQLIINIAISMLVALAICDCLAILGAVAMLRRQYYFAAVAGAIMVAMPTSICCLIGLPICLWSLLVLREPIVIAAFKQKKAHQGR